METRENILNIIMLIIDKVKPGGFILADNVLWGGKVLEKETTDPQARGIIRF